ncbi:MAG: TraE/TraK family type IV conjugative transfer system protein [bacterium]|nr:TraE/TraK family type IV conjugative transfer system protein [bacterium]
MAKGAVNKGMDQLQRVEGRAGSDTLKLWEGYREQAYLWRAIALLQMPATALAVFAALVMFFFADTVIQVPSRPQPGYYSVRELPDTAFIDVATEVVSLLGNYQPARAEYQYQMVQRFLWEPALTDFQKRMPVEIDKIITTGRSQMFLINPQLVKVQRDPSGEYVTVTLRGDRHKMIRRQKLERDVLEFYVKMTTIPRNISNAYGIVVVQLGMNKPSAKELDDINKEVKAEKEAEERKARKDRRELQGF